LLLLEAGFATRVTGLDWTGPALADARAAAAGLPYAVHKQDLAADPTVPPCDTALLIDVLYQLGPAAAGRLLSGAAQAARHPGTSHQKACRAEMLSRRKAALDPA